MLKRCCIILASAFILMSPLQVEAARGWDGIVKKIIDPKATEAYVKQVEELIELYEQGQKMQRQIEQMQQALEHFDFKNIDQAYNLLNDTMRDIEKIEKNAAGMAVTIGELEDNWTEMHTDYDAKDMTPEKKAELDKKRKERLERNAKVTADILSSMQDLKRERKQMEAMRNDLALLDSGKASPIKAAQVMTQMLTYQMEQQKRTQKLIAEKMRNELIKEEMSKDKEKQDKAEAEMQAAGTKKMIDKLGNHKKDNYTFSSPFMTGEEYGKAVSVKK